MNTRLLLLLLLTFLFMTACGTDPRQTAAADAAMLRANQDALTAAQERLQDQDVHVYVMSFLGWFNGVISSMSTSTKWVANIVIWAVGVSFAVASSGLILSFAIARHKVIRARADAFVASLPRLGAGQPAKEQKKQDALPVDYDYADIREFLKKKERVNHEQV